MKKVRIILALITLVSLNKVIAQEGFSAKAGLNIVTLKVDFGNAFGGSVSNSETGFYLGGGYRFAVDEKFSIEPGLLFSVVTDLTALYIPIMGQYAITDDFYAQAGPQINYLLEDVEDGAFGLDFAIGGGYNIDETWYVEARYGFEISRGGDFGEFASINTFSIGAGYRFN